jgi:hypothetical protein
VTLHNPTLLEIDPRPCIMCGLKIDQHEMIDEGEGPIFHCPDWTLDELERRAELRRQEEVAAIFARLEAMDDPSKRLPPPPAEPPPYRTPQATIDAFWYVVELGDPERFKAWLAARPDDAPFLLKLLESK